MPNPRLCALLARGCALGLLAAPHTALAQDRRGGTQGVYLWGDNRGGLIAGGGAKYVKTPLDVPYFRARSVRALAVSPSLAVAALANGDVVQWTEPGNQRVVLKGKNIRRLLVTPRSGTAVALAQNGALYFWTASTAPRPLPLAAGLGWFEKVVDVAAGVDHVAALTSRGRVFTGFVREPASLLADAEQFGQLGIAAFPYYEPLDPARTNKLYPVKLLDAPARQVACGDYHTLFLLDTGELWGSGSNAHGQLMLPFTYKNLKTSYPLKLLEDVDAVFAGSSLTVFRLKSEGCWMVAGNGEFGQFGTGSLSHCQVTPLKMLKLQGNAEFDEKAGKTVALQVSRFAIGESHVFAEMDSALRDWLAWGSSDRGQLGTNKLSKLLTPTPVASYMDQMAHTENLQFVAGDGISGCFYN